MLGENSYGELGNNSGGTNEISSKPVIVSGIDNATQVSVGWGFSCVLSTDQTVKCWGKNGSWLDSSSPETINLNGGETPISIQSQGGSACVLYSSGGVGCWGDNSRGKLGDGTNNSASTPQYFHQVQQLKSL